jgi:cell division protein FtsB
MRFARSIRRKAAAAVAPLLFLSLSGYFLWNATQGDRGLHAYARYEEDLTAAQAQLDRANGEVAIWERRVSGLRAENLDRDALDERVRAMLNLSRPDDIIVPYGEGKRLY